MDQVKVIIKMIVEDIMNKMMKMNVMLKLLVIDMKKEVNQTELFIIFPLTSNQKNMENILEWKDLKKFMMTKERVNL